MRQASRRPAARFAGAHLIACAERETGDKDAEAVAGLVADAGEFAAAVLDADAGEFADNVAANFAEAGAIGGRPTGVRYMLTLAMSEIVMGQLVAAIPSTLAALVSLWILKRGQTTQMATQAKIAEALDGKLTQLMTAEKAVSKEEGKQAERTEELGRQGAEALAKQNSEPASVIVKNTEDDPAIVKQKA